MDQIKVENSNIEEEQARLLEAVAGADRDVAQASSLLAEVRQLTSAEDLQCLNVRKEIEYQEKLVTDQKDICHI